MKAKKLYKKWKRGEIFEHGKLWSVVGLRKLMAWKKTWRLRKYKRRFDEY